MIRPSLIFSAPQLSYAVGLVDASSIAVPTIKLARLSEKGAKVGLKRRDKSFLPDLVVRPPASPARQGLRIFAGPGLKPTPRISDQDFMDSVCLSLEYDLMADETPTNKGWVPISAERFLSHAASCDFRDAWEFVKGDRPDMSPLAVVMKYSVDGGYRKSISFVPTTARLPIGRNSGFARFELDNSGVTIAKVWDRSTSQTHSSDLCRALSANPSVKIAKHAVARRHQECYNSTIELTTGQTLARSEVIFPFDLYAHPLFDGFTPYRVYLMIKFVAEPHGAVALTTYGNPVILRQYYDVALARIIDKMNQHERLRQSLTHARAINTSAISRAGDGHGPLRADADDLDPEQSIMNAQLVHEQMSRLPQAQRDVLELFFRGFSLNQIAQELGLGYDDVDQIYDLAVAGLVQATSQG